MKIHQCSFKVIPVEFIDIVMVIYNASSNTVNCGKK